MKWYVSSKSKWLSLFRRLDSNALVCDCEMVWLVKMLKEQMKDTQTAAICQQPQDMQGKSLAMMTDLDFHCRKF